MLFLEARAWHEEKKEEEDEEKEEKWEKKTFDDGWNGLWRKGTSERRRRRYLPKKKDKLQ